MCAHTHAHTHTHTHRAYVNTCACACTRTCTRTCTHAHTRTHMHARTHTHTHTHNTQSICKYIRICLTHTANWLDHEGQLTHHPIHNTYVHTPLSVQCPSPPLTMCAPPHSQLHRGTSSPQSGRTPAVNTPICTYIQRTAHTYIHTHVSIIIDSRHV